MSLQEGQLAGKGNAEIYHELAKELHNDTNVNKKLYQQNVFNMSNQSLNKPAQMPGPQLEESHYNNLPHRKVFSGRTGKMDNVFGQQDTHIQPSVAERHTYTPSKRYNMLADGHKPQSESEAGNSMNHPQYLVKKNKQTM
jgi:hypothetical protein